MDVTNMHYRQYLFSLSAILLNISLSQLVYSQPKQGSFPISTVPQQLATRYQDNIFAENNMSVQDYWISEKLDGIRARWTGQQLITRNGNIIHAPAWFTANFPQQLLEGELWLARSSFEKTASIVLRDTPNNQWRSIKLMLFDLPQHPGNFSQRLAAMLQLVENANLPHLQVIQQFKLANKDALISKLEQLVANGAEGLMLHHQTALYKNGRSTHLLKLKKHQDAEAKVIGHISGKGKYQNMLGSLLVELDNGLQFKIGSGFTDKQRQNPPTIGTQVTFKYFGLTAKGIPRFASFMRVTPIEN